LANFGGRWWTNMDFTDRMSQPVKTVHQVWEPDGKVPQKTRVEGTFLQANIREMEECAKAAHNVLERDTNQ
jgi:hypothetical protein